MKKLALHWWILIGMVAGVLVGIVAANLDAGRVQGFFARNPEVARDYGLSSQATEYRNALVRLGSLHTAEHDARRVAEFLDGRMDVVEGLKKGPESAEYKQAVTAIAAAVPDDNLALFLAENPQVAAALRFGDEAEAYARAKSQVQAARLWTVVVVDWIKPFGTLFMSLLKMIAVPLVLFSLVAGVASLNDTAKVGRIGGKTIVLYLATTAVAITIGLVVVNLVDPGHGMSDEIVGKLQASFADEVSKRSEVAKAVQGTSPLAQFFSQIVPTNPFGALSSGEMLQVVFFALMLGIALTRLDTKAADHVVKVFQLLSDAIIEMVMLIMKMAPFGVFALIAAVIAEMGEDMDQLTELLGSLAAYMGCVVLALVLHGLLVYTSILKFIAKVPLGRFYRGMIPAQLLAFSSSSSGATLPVTMRCAEKNIGVDEEVSGFVLPLGATINMDGTGLYQGVAAVFIANALARDLTMGDQLNIVLMATMASVGTAAVPGVGIIMLILVLDNIGIGAAGIALILGVDRPLDMCRTVLNVTGDATVATAVASSEGLLHDPTDRPTEVEDLDTPLHPPEPGGGAGGAHEDGGNRE